MSLRAVFVWSRSRRRVFVEIPMSTPNKAHHSDVAGRFAAQAPPEKQDDGMWFIPSAERNKGPILDILGRVLPGQGVVLEVASGTGQHIVHFAKAFPGLAWQPSDPDPELRESIALRVREEQIANVKPPIDLDVTTLPWPLQTAAALVCINMIHVCPWSATQALFKGANALLPAQHVLFLYGAYRRFGQHTSKSNEQFDAGLRAHDPEWGLRDIEAVSEAAALRGFVLAEVVEMPANNFSLIFKRT
jgi:SAM-dependent methyltransferase